MLYNGPMSNTAPVTLPDSSKYVRRTDAQYTHAAVIVFDRLGAITLAERSLAVHERGVACGATTPAQLRAARKALDALRSSEATRAYEVVSLHTSYAAADAAALRAARKQYCASVVLPVELG